MTKEQKFALDESIEEDIKTLEGEEVTEDEVEQEEETTTDDTEVVEEVEEEEKVEEKPKVEKPAVDHEALAKARFENSELKRQLAEKQKPVETKTEDVPDPKEDPLGYLAYENRKLKEKVEEVANWKKTQDDAKQQQDFYAAQVRGFNVAEEQFKATVPDYEEVSAHMIGEMKTAFKRLYPTATQPQIDGAVANKIIEMAEQAAQQGKQPVGYLYELSRTVYGYQPKPKEEVAQEKPKKPDLATIAKNQAKSKNGLAGQGSRAAITPEAYADMSIADMEAMGGDFYETFRA